MFENLGTAVIQLLGFLGVFSFFIYQLLSDNKGINNSSNNNSTNKRKSSNTKVNSGSRNLFGKKKNTPEEKILPKKGWFK